MQQRRSYHRPPLQINYPAKKHFLLMKPPRARLTLTASVITGLFATALFTSLATAEVNELKIGVRSTAEGWPKIKKAAVAEKAEKTRSQSYAILSVGQVPGGDDPLVKPVDAMDIAKEIEHQLTLQGFTKTAPKTKPEILITGEYGRGWLPNPYQGEVENPYGDEGAPVVNVQDMSQLIKQRENGYERRLQEARYEKLYIRVKAWKYPTSSKEKPELIWTTTMIVDDPDHRDLNGVFKEMLTSGAAFFGRPVDKPETEIFKPLPDGRVDVGAPTVVESVKK